MLVARKQEGLLDSDNDNWFTDTHAFSNESATVIHPVRTRTAIASSVRNKRAETRSLKDIFLTRESKP